MDHHKTTPIEYLVTSRVAMHEGEVDAAERLVAETRSVLDHISTVPMRMGQEGESPREVHADNAFLQYRFDMAREAVVRAMGILRGAEIRLDAAMDEELHRRQTR